MVFVSAAFVTGVPTAYVRTRRTNATCGSTRFRGRWPGRTRGIDVAAAAAAAVVVVVVCVFMLLLRFPLL